MTKPRPEPEPYLADFEALWGLYPRKRQRIPALKKYQARRREGIPAEDLLQAVKNYAAECYRKGRAQEFIMLAKTFLGPSRIWEDSLNPEPEEARPNTTKARKCHARGGCRSSWSEVKDNVTCRWCSINLRSMRPPKERA